MARAAPQHGMQQRLANDVKPSEDGAQLKFRAKVKVQDSRLKPFSDVLLQIYIDLFCTAQM